MTDIFITEKRHDETDPDKCLDADDVVGGRVHRHGGRQTRGGNCHQSRCGGTDCNRRERTATLDKGNLRSGTANCKSAVGKRKTPYSFDLRFRHSREFSGRGGKAGGQRRIRVQTARRRTVRARKRAERCAERRLSIAFQKHGHHLGAAERRIRHAVHAESESGLQRHGFHRHAVFLHARLADTLRRD